MRLNDLELYEEQQNPKHRLSSRYNFLLEFYLQGFSIKSQTAIFISISSNSRFKSKLNFEVSESSKS